MCSHKVGLASCHRGNSRHRPSHCSTRSNWMPIAALSQARACGSHNACLRSRPSRGPSPLRRLPHSLLGISCLFLSPDCKSTSVRGQRATGASPLFSLHCSQSTPARLPSPAFASGLLPVLRRTCSFPQTSPRLLSLYAMSTDRSGVAELLALQAQFNQAIEAVVSTADEPLPSLNDTSGPDGPPTKAKLLAIACAQKIIAQLKGPMLTIDWSFSVRFFVSALAPSADRSVGVSRSTTYPRGCTSRSRLTSAKSCAKRRSSPEIRTKVSLRATLRKSRASTPESWVRRL